MAVQFGNAVEKMVAERIRNDPALRQLFVHTPNLFRGASRSVYDFAGIGRAQGLLFDITTNAAVDRHTGRWYGKMVEYITYDIPPGFKFPP